MIILLAPSKTMDFTGLVNTPKSQPLFPKEASQIVSAAKNSVNFQELAKTSDKLTAETLAKFEKWGTKGSAGQRAMQAYVGIVYDGLNYKSWNLQDIDFAQQHLRILSGLYGYVRPCDLIEQYRLEMQTKLPVGDSKDLYDFWDDRIAKALLADKPEFIVNVTSEEYMKSVRKYLPSNLKIITPKFLENKNGKLVDVTIYTKTMRGIYASWLVKSKITEVSKLKEFNFGYTYSPKLSSGEQPVFIKS